MGKIRFPLFEKEGPGEICAVTDGSHRQKNLPQSPPLPKGDFCSRLYILNCDKSPRERGEGQEDTKFIKHSFPATRPSSIFPMSLFVSLRSACSPAENPSIFRMAGSH